MPSSPPPGLTLRIGSSYVRRSSPARARASHNSLSREAQMVKGAVMNNFNEPLKIESLTLKPPREDEVVVKVVASGVCHSDLSVLQAKLPMPPPCILGHEGAGIVEEVGKGVKDLKPGDHVVMAWVQPCGKCHFCVGGQAAPLRGRHPVGDGGRGVRLREGRHADRPHGRRRLVRRPHRRARLGGDQDPRGRAARPRLPGRLRRHDRRRRGDQHRQGRSRATPSPSSAAAASASTSSRARRCRGAARIIAVDLMRGEAQAGQAVRRHRHRQRQGRPTRRPRSASSPAASASTTPSR